MEVDQATSSTRLDVMPLQVHIEAQVAEVALSGDLSYGVNWFFERAVTDNGLPTAVGRDTWSTLAGSIKPAGGTNPGLAWTFLGRNAAAVISALDEVTDVQMLQSPSVMVRNNYEATFNVGEPHPDLVGDGQPRPRQRHGQPGPVPRHRHHPQGASARDQGRHGVPRHRPGSQLADRRSGRERQRPHRRRASSRPMRSCRAATRCCWPA